MILAFLTAATASTVTVQDTAYGHIVDENVPTVEKRILTVNETEAAVREYFADLPIMIEVARCESHFRHQLSDGSILHGKVDPADTGVMQINKRYHEKSATAMNLDLDNLYDNMAYARYLYETQGTRPWSASMPCWGNTLVANI